MLEDITKDQFVVIRIKGMHCHKCETMVQKSIRRLPGVREVEVDFPTAQASVLYDSTQITISDLLQAVTQVGYQPTGFVKNDS